VVGQLTVMAQHVDRRARRPEHPGPRGGHLDQRQGEEKGVARGGGRIGVLSVRQRRRETQRAGQGQQFPTVHDVSSPTSV